SAQLEARELRSLPLPTANRGIRGRDPAGDTGQEGQRVLRGRDRVAGRGIHDGDPGRRRGIEVDVVDADARPADDLEAAAGRGDDVAIDLDLAADDERVVVGECRAQLVTPDPGTFVDVVLRAESGDAF